MESSSSSPMLVLITSGDCGYCKSFKKVWPEISEAVRGMGVRIEHVMIPTMSSHVDTKVYPADLDSYRFWFPMLLLVSGTTWNRALVNRDTKLNAIMLNAVPTDNGGVRPGGTTKMDTEGITGWIQSNMSKLVSASVVPLHPAAPSGSRSLLTNKSSVCKLKVKPKRNK